MGSLWLVNLPEWFENAGLHYRLYSGWETRARSTGGYEAIYAIGTHHDASGPSSSPAAIEDYQWKNADSRPIGAVYLRRDGSVTIGAAGATNTMGKGGPLTCTDGTVPQDRGNEFMFAIEAANNGQGEAWPKVQLDAYFTLVGVLCDRLGLADSDVYSHAGYCQPSCPGRKIDPAGPTPDYPSLGGTSGARTWPDAEFRKLIRRDGEDDEVTQDDINKIAAAVWNFMLTDPTVSKDIRAGDLLEYTRGAAANADRQTRAGDAKNSISEEVWQTQINTVDGPMNAGSVLGKTYAEAKEANG